jgi:hypothetical protein
MGQPFNMGYMQSQTENVPVSPFSTKGMAQGLPMVPRTEVVQMNRHQRMVSDAPTYESSKYSSGFSLFDQFADVQSAVRPGSLSKTSPQEVTVALAEEIDRSDGSLRSPVTPVGVAL